MPSFRLRRLLRLRSQLRLLREHEASALACRTRLLAGRLEAAHEAQAQTLVREQGEAAAGTLTPDTLQLGRDYARALAYTERADRAQMVEVQRLLAHKREELLASHRDEATVRRLEEAHRVRLAEEQGRLAAQDLDELAIDRHERVRRRR